MRTKKIEMDVVGAPLLEARLQLFEDSLGKRLPDDYREFLLGINGGNPSAKNNVAPTSRKGAGETIIQCFYGLDTGQKFFEIERVMENMQRRFGGKYPSLRVPFANDGLGNKYVLSLEEGAERGTVYFLALDDGDKFRRVADSFAQFLDALRSQDEYDPAEARP